MQIYDVALVGFGPNNLAVAYNLIKQAPDLNVAVIDPHVRFMWNEGYPKGFLQIVEPSKASITPDITDDLHIENFIHNQHNSSARNILSSKISHGLYREYLKASCRTVEYSARSSVSFYWGVSARQITQGGEENALQIASEYFFPHRREVIRAKVVSIGMGAPPKQYATLSSHCVSPMSHFQYAIKRSPACYRQGRFCIIGKGQSAGDAICELLQRYPDAKIDWIVSGGVPRSSDENSFVNRHYTFEEALKFYELPDPCKQHVLDGLNGTNTGVVSKEALADIYAAFEDEKVRILEKLPDYPRLEDYDLCFSAIGTEDPEGFTASFLPTMETPLNLTADYRILGRSVFIPGGFKRTHGPTAGTICDLGKRAEFTVKGILQALSS